MDSEELRVQEVTSVLLDTTVRRENPRSVVNREKLVFRECMDPEVSMEFPGDVVQRVKRAMLERYELSFNSVTSN